MYRFIRHPNYLGEMMIYGSFALMVWHWLPFVVLAWVWGLFVVNMILKEASMSRYPLWGQYKKRSWWLLPPVVWIVSQNIPNELLPNRDKLCSWFCTGATFRSIAGPPFQSILSRASSTQTTEHSRKMLLGLEAASDGHIKDACLRRA